MKVKNDLEITQDFITANETGTDTVQGQLLRFEEAPNHLFFTHKETKEIDIDDEGVPQDEIDVYVISELSTGMRVNSKRGDYTQSDAIKASKKKLSSCNFDEVLVKAREILNVYMIEFPVNDIES